jgi:hypothetical protein
MTAKLILTLYIVILHLNPLFQIQPHVTTIMIVVQILLNVLGNVVVCETLFSNFFSSSILHPEL